MKHYRVSRVLMDSELSGLAVLKCFLFLCEKCYRCLKLYRQQDKFRYHCQDWASRRQSLCPATSVPQGCRFLKTTSLAGYEFLFDSKYTVRARSECHVIVDMAFVSILNCFRLRPLCQKHYSLPRRTVLFIMFINNFCLHLKCVISSEMKKQLKVVLNLLLFCLWNPSYKKYRKCTVYRFELFTFFFACCGQF